MNTSKRSLKKFSEEDKKQMRDLIENVSSEGGSFFLRLHAGQIMAIPRPYFSTTGHKALSTMHHGTEISICKLIKATTGLQTARFKNFLYYVTASGHRVAIDI